MGPIYKEISDPYPFVKVSDVSKLVPILESRLPNSCFLYNSAKVFGRFEKTAFYTLYGDIDETSWIVFTHFREDYGRDYLISANEEKSKISRSEALKILSNSGIFDWDDAYCFACLERWVSSIIFEISANIKGNCVEVHPTYLYYKEIEECLKLDVRSPDPDRAVIRRLDSKLGTEFILNTWKYAKDDSDLCIKRCIEQNESGSVYYDGKPVCGVYVAGWGMLTALYTLKEHRKKGYGSLAMKFAYKELAKNGLMPGSTVECKNKPSMLFHESLECKLAGVLDYILFHNTGF